METWIEIDERYAGKIEIWAGDLPSLPPKGSIITLDRDWVVTESKVFLHEPEDPCFWVYVKPKSVLARIAGRLWWGTRDFRSWSRYKRSLKFKFKGVRCNVNWALRFLERYA